MILSFFALYIRVFVNSQVSSLRKNLLLIFWNKNRILMTKNEFWNYVRFMPRWEVFLAIISFNCFLSRNWSTLLMTTHSSTHLPTHTDNTRLRRSPIWVITEPRKKKKRLFIPVSSFAMKNWIKTLIILN